MKLTLKQAEQRMTAVWGKSAIVVPYRISGNRYVYAVTDHGEHWLPLDSSWSQGRQVFALVDAEWPLPEEELKQQLAQVNDCEQAWADSVLDATQLARAYFLEQGNKAALKRLPRAQVIAERQNWRKVGDKFDTWLMPSSTESGKVYQVNGRCSCPDPVRWCKHCLARAIAKRAEAILKEDNGEENGAAAPMPAPVETQVTSHAQLGTAPLNGDAQRIDLTVAYRSNEAKALAHVNANGQLIGFKADGEEVAPPVQTMPELYRWLQEHGYTPNDFKWLAWERGLRHRRQSYVREAAA